MKRIIVKITSLYGKEMIYPVCESGKLFASIAGTKTITRRDLVFIKALGYTVEVVSTVSL